MAMGVNICRCDTANPQRLALTEEGSDGSTLFKAWDRHEST